MFESLLELMDSQSSIWDGKPSVAKEGPASLEAIIGALVPTSITAVAFILAFIVLRPRYRNIYAPRTYFRTIQEKDRTPSTGNSANRWWHDYTHIDDRFILRHHSFDAYLFLRFFRIIILISAIGCCLTWPILLPINVNGGGGATQLNKLNFGNVADKNQLWGHAIVAVIFLGFVLLLVNRERLFLIGLRQAYVTTKANSNRLSSRTVLFLAVPRDAMKESQLQKVFGDAAVRSWKVTKLDDLEGMVDKRNKKIYELETAEVSLAQNVIKQMSKSDSGNPHTNADDPSALSSDPEVRPTHRKVPLVGEKLDSIDHLLETLPSVTESIDEIREKQAKSPARHTGALFVEFKDLVSAHQAFQQVQHHSPLALQPRYIGVQPKDVQWSNLTLDPALRITYSYVAVAVLIATTILWSIPVGIVGTLSNIDYLTDKVKFLRFINNLPPAILGLIKGFLPPYALSYIVQYVPFFFQHVAQSAGSPTSVETQKFIQTWYFFFQVVQVFLVTTFSSGVTTVITKIANNPGNIPNLLASNLPKASNFYLTYFILQGLTKSPENLIRYSDVFMYEFGVRYLDKTPRQKYEREISQRGLFWGSNYPKYTNLAVIAIAYSCIAPLVLGFAAIGLSFFYIGFRYNMLYTMNIKIDTKGACYAVALQQLLTGVYLAELCLIGLFGTKEATGPSIIMIIMLVLTIIYHITINKYLSPMEEYMPLDVLKAAGEDDTEDTEANNASDDEEPTDTPADSPRSRIKSIAHKASTPHPTWLLDPLARLLEPRIFASMTTLRPYLSASTTTSADRTSSTIDEVPEYTASQVDNAYRNPALTSKTPIVWLPKDAYGISADMKERIEKVKGVQVSDEAASVGKDGVVRWDQNAWEEVPVFKKATLF